jgi:hypothetical protein
MKAKKRKTRAAEIKHEPFDCVAMQMKIDEKMRSKLEEIRKVVLSAEELINNAEIVAIAIGIVVLLAPGLYWICAHPIAIPLTGK